MAADLQFHRRTRIRIVAITERDGRKNLALRVLGAFDVGAQDRRQDRVVARMTLQRQLKSSVGAAGAKLLMPQNINKKLAIAHYALHSKVLQRINQFCDGNIPVWGMG